MNAHQDDLAEGVADFLCSAVNRNEFFVAQDPVAISRLIRTRQAVERRGRDHLALLCPAEERLHRAERMELFRRKFLEGVRDREDIFRRDAVEPDLLVLAQEVLGEQPLLFLAPTWPRLRMVNF